VETSIGEVLDEVTGLPGAAVWPGAPGVEDSEDSDEDNEDGVPGSSCLEDSVTVSGLFDCTAELAVEAIVVSDSFLDPAVTSVEVESVVAGSSVDVGSCEITVVVSET
jgi:hypothetical protein